MFVRIALVLSLGFVFGTSGSEPWVQEVLDQLKPSIVEYTSTKVKTDVEKSMEKVMNTQTFGQARFMEFDIKNLSVQLSDITVLPGAQDAIRLDTWMEFGGPCSVQAGWKLANINLK